MADGGRDGSFFILWGFFLSGMSRGSAVENGNCADFMDLSNIQYEKWTQEKTLRNDEEQMYHGFFIREFPSKQIRQY